MRYFIIFFLLSSNIFAQDIQISTELINKLKETRAVNMKEVILDLNLLRLSKRRNPKRYKMANPFYPMTRVDADKVELPASINGQSTYRDHKDGTVSFYHQQSVFKWFNLMPIEKRKAEVCGVKFLDDEDLKYHLKTFSSSEDALDAGYTITHQNHCGACSSLHDLAIYLEKRNMVNDGRKCAKKLTFIGSKKCHIKRIGLSEYCSEAWAYNAIATRNRCFGTCVKEYGLWNLIRGKFPDTYINPDGTLKPCILCDELKSGGGYAYAAGRTRRSSGIVSAIDRGDEEVYPINFKTYYEVLDLEIPFFSKKIE
jgi:hypothetical protein